MSTKNALDYMIAQKLEVVLDKWKVELDTKNHSDVSVSWIGHMQATPTQFYTNFLVRKEYCIQYVIRGKGNYFTNNRLYSLKKGTLWLLPKDQYHYYTSEKNDPYEYYWLHMDGNGAERFLNAIGLSESNPVIHNLTDPNIESRFNRLIEVAKKESPNEHLVLSALHSLLYEIENAYNQLSIKTPHDPNDHAVDDVIAYIKANYTKNVTLQDLANVALLDKMYLIKKFKAQTGSTPVQFLIQYRISQSCCLLHSTMPLSEIAARCGFNNLTNYLRRFKDFLGLTPTQYRKTVCTAPISL